MHKPRAPAPTLPMCDNDGKLLIAADLGKAVWWPLIVFIRDESCPAHPTPAEPAFRGAPDDDWVITLAAPIPAGRGRRPAREVRQKRAAREDIFFLMKLVWLAESMNVHQPVTFMSFNERPRNEPV
jgi:hypothetical protein